MAPFDAKSTIDIYRREPLCIKGYSKKLIVQTLALGPRHNRVKVIAFAL